MSLDPETRQLIATLLHGPAAAPALPPALESELLRKGAVLALQQDGSDEAIEVLAETGRLSDLESVQTLAIDALAALAGVGNTAAVMALATLGMEHDVPAARDTIRARNLSLPSGERQAAFDLLAGDRDELLKTDPDLRLLTRFTLEQAGENLALRILHAAGRAGLSNWVAVLRAVRASDEESSAALVERYPAFSPAERRLALDLLDAAARQGDAHARESLSQFFIQYEDSDSLALAQAGGYAPRDALQRALFLFLSQQWQAYETLDFNHRLLITAYETADARMRKRLLDISRLSGQIEWFEGLSSANRTRWLRDLSDADWEIVLHGLKSAGRFEDLWRLAQLASPLWSAQILSALQEAGWQPENITEQESFRLLAQLGARAASAPAEIRERHNFLVPTMDNLLSLAISSDGQTLALGSSSNAIHLWRIDAAPKPLPTLYAASTQSHAVVFSPDGEHLAASMADQTIRVYQWSEGRNVKALQGHTGLIRSLAVAPDGRALYSAGFDGTLRAWRFPYGPDGHVLAHSQGEYFALALSPDGDQIVSGGADRTLDVHQLPEGKKVRALEGHTATVLQLSAAPTTPLVASTGRDQTIRVWNMLSGRALQAFEAGNTPITGLCIHPNEQILISASRKGELQVLNISTGRVLLERSLFQRAVIGLGITPAGDMLISASAEGTVKLWDLAGFLLARQPVEDMPLDRAALLQKQLDGKTLSPVERAWLTFTLELLRWKQRFDIQLETGQMISVGEFDIQL